MLKHLPVLIAAGLLAAVPGSVHAAHIGYDDCSIVTDGAPATAQESDCVGVGFPVGADTYTVEAFPDGGVLVTREVIPSDGSYQYDSGLSTTVQYGTFTIAVWKSKAAYTSHAAALHRDTLHVTP